MIRIVGLWRDEHSHGGELGDPDGYVEFVSGEDWWSRVNDDFPDERFGSQEAALEDCMRRVEALDLG